MQVDFSEKDPSKISITILSTRVLLSSDWDWDLDWDLGPGTWDLGPGTWDLGPRT